MAAAGGAWSDGPLNAFVVSVLSGLHGRVRERVARPWSEVEDEIRREAESLRQLNATRVVDTPSTLWLSRACLVLAAFRVLSRFIEDRAERLDILRAAVVNQLEQRMDSYLVERLGLDTGNPREGFARISENFKKRGEERFGAAFIYEQDVQDARRSFVSIRRCGFNDFFRANGSAEVTAVFCALDIAWADEIRKQNYGVSFSRPTTLAEGHDACRFQFRRTAERG